MDVVVEVVVVVVVVLDKSDRESLATSSASSLNLVKNENEAMAYDCNFIAEIIQSTIIRSQETRRHQSQAQSTGKEGKLARRIVS